MASRSGKKRSWQGSHYKTERAAASEAGPNDSMANYVREKERRARSNRPTGDTGSNKKTGARNPPTMDPRRRP